MFAGAFLGQLATIVGLMAGGIAIGGFLGQAGSSMSGNRESELRRDTTVGGLIGMGLATGLSVLAVFVNLLS